MTTNQSSNQEGSWLDCPGRTSRGFLSWEREDKIHKMSYRWIVSYQEPLQHLLFLQTAGGAINVIICHLAVWSDIFGTDTKNMKDFF